ncbi:MAG TPA: formylglycine-generating enzyme family protein [Phycisphaerae bacterium]|nr:formylglycine-generating enzyme family protein [Phycisphaerae bacterium]HOM51628.1 formylglycine-generating enzyme family protein [Phycisphaerae bacterium]HPP25600.1 formylglycine-generating enzyme family protein [Phycisphaerae bacterium]HQE28577.1 formylglycine-generating enzyme family protein [Phycisphaerae bacterium]
MPTQIRRAFMGLVALAFASQTYAASPVVSSVLASQRPDKIVEIQYDLSDADGDACTVTVQASSDGGNTWTVPVTALSGDVGPDILPGDQRIILWDCKVDLPGVIGSRFKIRICADDGENQAPSISNPAVTGGFNQGEPSTVEVTCLATDPDGTVLSVTVNLGALGGPTALPLSPGSAGQWHGKASITPPTRGTAHVTFTAVDNREASTSIQVSVEVLPPGMVLIPSGQFQMGDPFYTEGDLAERPLHNVVIDEILLARHEVTNRDFAEALNWARAQGGLITVSNGTVYRAGSGTTYPLCDTTTSSDFSRITWNGDNFGVVPGKENHPVVLVSWYGAAAYANWRSAMAGLPPAYDAGWNCNFAAGYRLPTEAEWERAARGGAVGHRFPWSDSDMIDHSRANYYSSAYPFYDLEETAGYHPMFGVGERPYTSPVGYFDKNDYGLYDMAGNVWEWCNDWFDNGYYATSPTNNPHGPLTGTTRVLRGGSWSSLAVNQRCAYRTSGIPSYRAITHGFRLALPRN